MDGAYSGHSAFPNINSSVKERPLSIFGPVLEFNYSASCALGPRGAGPKGTLEQDQS